MARPEVMNAIKDLQTKAEQPAVAMDQTPEPDTSIPNELKGRLASARVNMKNATKDYVLQGIGDALEEIAAGDLGDVSQLIDAVDVFSERVTAPKAQRAIATKASPSSLFALPQAN